MKNHFYFKKDLITPFEVGKINRCLTRDIDNSLSDNPSDSADKTAVTNIVQWRQAKAYLSEIHEYLHQVNRDVFGFELYRFTDYNTVNYNEYNSMLLGEYGWHNDFVLTERIYDYKLTCVVNISEEPYEGGDFELFLNGAQTATEFTSGSMIIFPSWTQHRVTPVTSGIRKTLSFWTQGPKFR